MPATPPTGISGLEYRWVGSSGIGVADGAPVPSWTDAIASSAAAEATNPPLFRASVLNFNGKPGVEFNGSTSKLTATITDDLQPTTWFAVLDDIAGTGNAEILQSSQEMGYFGSGIAIYGGSANATGDARVTGLRIVIGVWNGASSVLYWKDGGVPGALKTASANIGSFGTGTTVRFGYHSSAAWPNFNGRFAEIGRYSGGLTAQQAQDLYDWFAQEYGVAWAKVGRPLRIREMGGPMPGPSMGTPFRLLGSRSVAAAGGSTVDLAGTTGITFGGSGAITNAVSLAGTTSIVFGGSGAMSKAVALAGTTAITFGGSGSVSIAVALGGTTALTFGGSGNVGVNRGLAGLTGITFGTSGNLSRNVGLAGTTAIVFGLAGQIDTIADVLVLIGAPRTGWDVDRLDTGWSVDEPELAMAAAGAPITGWAAKPPRETP